MCILGSQHEAETGAEDGAMRCLLEERSSSDSSRSSSSSSEFWTDTGDALEATEDEMESIPAMAEFLSSSPAVWRRSLIWSTVIPLPFVLLFSVEEGDGDCSGAPDVDMGKGLFLPVLLLFNEAKVRVTSS